MTSASAPREGLSSPRSLPLWARIETLWLLFVPLCATIYGLLQPLAPNDLWYHVRAGELIARAGALPTTNAMSGGMPLNTPYFYQSWLAEWLLYQTIHIGGLGALQWLRALCLGLTFLMVVGATLTWTRSQGSTLKSPFANAARAGAFATLWGFLIASNNVDLRPQSFSLPLCACWLWLLIALWLSPSKAKIAGLAVVAGIWANTHGAFVVAPATLLLLAIATTIGDSLKLSARVKALWLAFGVVMLATLVNPHGIQLYPYLARLSNNTIGQKYIQEWRSPGFNEWHSLLFWFSPLLVALLWIWARPAKSNWPYLLPLALVWVMGARDQRAMIWFALFLAPLMGSLIASKLPAPEPAVVPRAAQFINGVLLIFLLCAPLFFSPGVKGAFPWPPAFTDQFAPTPTRIFPGAPPLLLDRSTPVAAIEWWAKHPPKTRIWCDMVCGSYMTWATHPQILPLCEPRIELYPVSFWEDYVRLSTGPKGAGQQLLHRGFSQALLDVESQAGLFAELKKEGWKVVAHNGSTALLLAP